MANRRLGQAEPVAGGSETPKIPNCEEDTQQIEVKRAIRPIHATNYNYELDLVPPFHRLEKLHSSLPTALPGVRINTSANNNQVWMQLQLQRWTGSRWEPFGEILDAGSEQVASGDAEQH